MDFLFFFVQLKNHVHCTLRTPALEHNGCARSIKMTTYNGYFESVLNGELNMKAKGASRL